MDEADTIILNELKQIGCQIPEDAKNPGDFTAPVLVHCVLRCLRIWDKSRDYPRNLATTRAQKVSQTNQIVKALKDLEYNEDISYHILLYPNAQDSRKLLSWLLAHIPIKETLNDATSILNQKIEDEIDFLTSPNCVWTPYFCSASSERNQRFYNLTPVHTRYLYSPTSPLFYPGGRSKPTDQQKRYFSSYLPVYTSQVENSLDAPISILETNVRQFTDAKEWDDEWNSNGISSGLSTADFKKEKKKKVLSNMAEYIRAATSIKQGAASESLDDFLKSFAGKGEENSLDRAAKFTIEKKNDEEKGETEEEIAKRREKERDDIDKSLAEAEALVQSTEQEFQVCTTEIMQLRAALQIEADKTAELKKKYKEIKEAMDLLKNADENIQKLRQFAQTNKDKLIDFGRKWELVRIPLVEEYRILKDKYSRREDEIKVKLEEIKAIRAEMKTLKASITRKDARYKELVAIFKELPKDSRSNYTSKILALVESVKKQRVEIAKILMDMKNVQKEINVVTDKLNRTFTVVEEMIFQEAKKDVVGSEAYKLTVKLHDMFTQLTDTISKTGQSTNAGLLLTDKIDKLEKRTTALNMQQIEDDLKQVREENAKLQAKYKELVSDKSEKKTKKE